MNYRSGTQIREDFLRFFESKAHRRVHSSSLVPQNDPTLLFTNAGMNQFKDVFLGAETRPYTRAASSQKCVRAGGKHNDLENVGFTRRHHTFFEMLGNFSFGDYFKREAIAYAWELLTSKEWFGIDPARLYVTIFEGDAAVPRDDEAQQYWIETGVPADRIFAMSAKDNFWQMGETGPCGPCSEIFYDLGLAASESGKDLPFPEDDQRYVEIWNLVFMQFDRTIAPEGPVLTPLPKPSIDTGMGLERIACVLQNVLSNYQTDLFTPLIARAAQLTNFNLAAAPGAPSSPVSSAGWAKGAPQTPGAPSSPAPSAGWGKGAPQTPGAPSSPASSAGWGIERSETLPPISTVTQELLTTAALSDHKGYASLRIIADHARAATFLISDGVQPANEGRGYVLRKILRRGIRHGRLLGQEQPFMHHMVLAVRDEMQSAYPELIEQAPRVAKVVLAEEEQFARVLSGALAILQKDLDDIATPPQAETETTLGLAAMEPGFDPSTAALEQALIQPTPTYPGERAFHLYETYGLPLDFMVDAARDAGIAFDHEGFERAKEEEQARARASWKGGSQKSANPIYQDLPKTEFEGYVALRVDGAKVLALIKGGQGTQSLAPGEEGEAILDATSFYADSGGQIGDTGTLLASDHHTPVAEVRGATKPVQGVFAHKILAKQTIAVGDTVDTVVNHHNRTATERNHTGTHLLHAALREVLGKHVKQAGSLVNQNRLRFDFSHFTAVSDPELQEIEDIVNHQVLANAKVETLVDVPIEVAVKELGAMALFGEKYGDRVRVVKIGDFSTELCGGTHTRSTGEIGLIKLVGESSVSSGVRRLEALSGTGALTEFRRDYDVARLATQLTGSSADPAEALRTRLNTQDEELKKLRRELDQARMKAASANTADSAPIEIKGIQIITQRVTGLDKGQMRTLVDTLRTKLGSGIVILGAESEGRVSLIAGVTKDLTGTIQAGKIVALLAAQVGGKGGGRPDLAEAGGSNPAALDATLASAPQTIATLLP
jgi:alanyl-tRNA synthetase